MSLMRDEIRQQPAALERTLVEEWPSATKLRAHFEQNPVRFIVLAARGKSDNAAKFGRYVLEITTGIPTCLATPSVYTLYESQLNLKDAAVIAISQSGELLGFRQPRKRIVRQLANGSRRNIVQNNGQAGRVGDRPKVLVNAALHRLVVIRHDRKDGVCARRLGAPCQLNGLCG